MFQSAVEVKTHRQDPLRRLCKFQCTKRVSLVLPIVIENGPPRANPPRRHLISNWTAWGLHFPFGAEWQSILNCKISRCGNNAISRIHVFCMILCLAALPLAKKIFCIFGVLLPRSFQGLKQRPISNGHHGQHGKAACPVPGA